MSTKIYNGFKVKGLTFHEVHKRLDEFRDKHKAYFEELFLTPVIHRAVENFDEHTLGRVSKRNSLIKLYMEDQESKSITTGRARGALYEVALLPISPRKILGMTFAKGNGHNLLLQEDWVEEWGYFNNTDKPETIPEREWTQRRKEWDKALGETGVPANEGYCRVVIEVPPLPGRDMVNRILSECEFERRVEAMAGNIAFKEFMEAQPQEEQGKGPIRAWFRFQDEKKKSAELREKIAKLADDIRPKLKPDLTYKDLCGGKYV